MLGKKRRCRVVEVVRPEVDGGRPSDGCRDVSLLAEAKYADPVGDEVQASEEEGLDGSKTGGTHIPIGGSAGNSSERKRIILPEPAMAKVAEKWAIR